MNEDSRPVTREELREELTRFPTREELRETLKQELARYATKDDLAQVVQTMSQQHERLVEMLQTSHGSLVEMMQTTVSATEHRLMVEIGRATRAAAEEHRRELGVLDDRYRDLPGRVGALERDLDEHRRDATAHRRPRRPRKR
jgi:type I site-specific restriction endonuclease